MRRRAKFAGPTVERNVRQILEIQGLAAFQRSVQLCAGRIGQLVNISSLASDAGVTRVAAESWISVLRASHFIFIVQPWFTNLNKRPIKTPKLYLCDPGFAAWFLGIRKVGHVAAHPQRGALFENWAMTELPKAHKHRGGWYQERERGTVLPWNDLSPLVAAISGG